MISVVDHPWTADRLRQVLRTDLESRRLVIVSNRQPYSHERLHSGQVSVRTAVGGVVTLLSPVIRACSGTWVAYGSGSADREIVDGDDRVRVPPDSPAYLLRRVWLTELERRRYYEGFSNQGLWPLCHTTPVEPIFRGEEWLAYKKVNGRFADTALQECGGDSPVIFVQDYHLALLPQLLRKIRPEATVVQFWHIPWPSPGRLALCPWWREIVRHMLGSDLLGFNTAEHCDDFLSAAGRLDDVTVHSGAVGSSTGHICRVAAYPDSIEWTPPSLAGPSSPERDRAEVRRRFGIAPDVSLGLSVERCDPTKGILERLWALERMLTVTPRWRGGFTLLQLAVPSRSAIPAYQALQQAIAREVLRINSRFATSAWKPVVWLQEEQSREQLQPLYESADVCLVNSLHDGMNLVAKEFVAARDDEDGVLILSRCAGAARELVEAVLIDPLDIPATAEAIDAALQMPRDERRVRMRAMRRTVERDNVYRWAGHILMDAAKARRSRRVRRAVS